MSIENKVRKEVNVTKNPDGTESVRIESGSGGVDPPDTTGESGEDALESYSERLDRAYRRLSE